ncbi:hypothetical protein [Porphyrobacter sp. HT-58-2]|uniref:hypothetical protein n=1 Tax=Porphyrobacter sp. HT-58-2 TaxID=2023229 RepID=UPI003FA6D43F
MRAVNCRDTSPELKLRKALYAAGYRYRLYRKDLPGSPDLVFVSQKVVVFVHGCFWHGHTCKRGARVPKPTLNTGARRLPETCLATPAWCLISMPMVGVPKSFGDAN